MSKKDKFPTFNIITWCLCDRDSLCGPFDLSVKELASSKTSFVQQLKELEIKLKTKDLSLKEQSFSGSAKTTTFAWYEVLLFLSLFGSIFFSFSSCNGQFYPKMTNYSELKIALG